MTEQRPPTIRDYVDAVARMAEQARPAFARLGHAITTAAESARGLDSPEMRRNWGAHVRPTADACVLSRCPSLGPCTPSTCPEGTRLRRVGR